MNEAVFYRTEMTSLYDKSVFVRLEIAIFFGCLTVFASLYRIALVLLF
jgi:hypothetical protein